MKKMRVTLRKKAQLTRVADDVDSEDPTGPATDAYFEFAEQWGSAFAADSIAVSSLFNLAEAGERAAYLLENINSGKDIWDIPQSVKYVIRDAERELYWLSRILEETQPDNYREIMDNLIEERSAES